MYYHVHESNITCCGMVICDFDNQQALGMVADLLITLYSLSHKFAFSMNSEHISISSVFLYQKGTTSISESYWQINLISLFLQTMQVTTTLGHALFLVDCLQHLTRQLHMGPVTVFLPLVWWLLKQLPHRCLLSLPLMHITPFLSLPTQPTWCLVLFRTLVPLPPLQSIALILKTTSVCLG